MPRCGQSSTVRRYRAVNPAASIARCRCRARFVVAQAVQRRDPGLEATGIWRMSVYGSGCCRRLLSRRFRLSSVTTVAVAVLPLTGSQNRRRSTSSRDISAFRGNRSACQVPFPPSGKKGRHSQQTER
jgi:hypothetical protein